MRLGRRTTIVLATVAGVALGGYAILRYPAWTRTPVGAPVEGLPAAIEDGSEPTADRFVGHTEADIVSRFGPPTHSWSGHYGAPPLQFQHVYHDATTATYVRAGGVLYLSYCVEGGRRVCFTSHWMPEGCVF